MLRCWAVALAAWMSLHVPSQARTQPWWHRGDSRRRGECSPLLAGIQLHDTLACTRVADDQSWMMPRRAGIRLSQVEVRFEDVSIESDVFVGSRALPSVTNEFMNYLQARPHTAQQDSSIPRRH